MLQAIRDDLARPTVHARNLFHLSAAMYDAWAAYDRSARPWSFGDTGSPSCRPSAFPLAGAVREAREEALSYAAWRLIRHRFRSSPNAARTGRNADSLMSALGFDPAGGGGAAALGRCIGAFYVARGLKDGSNEAMDYEAVAYRPANEDLDPWRPGNPDLRDPDRWQPLWLRGFIDQSGNLTGDGEAVAVLWRVCEQMRPWNDTLRDIGSARANASSDNLRCNAFARGRR